MSVKLTEGFILTPQKEHVIPAKAGISSDYLLISQKTLLKKFMFIKVKEMNYIQLKNN